MNRNIFLKGIQVLLIILLAVPLIGQNADIQFFRPYNKDGLTMFETTKEYTPYAGPRVRIGASFTQQFQALESENKPFFDSEGIPMTKLMETKPGFNLATANLNLDAQLDDGIRLNVITYLSSRHHAEAWVKGGYIQFDKLPFLKSDFINRMMEKVTIKVGHMEINYGDGHFRRTDNGNALYNPFVGNYILDAFNTEIGAELYYQDQGFLAMAGITGGEINGNVGALSETATDDNAHRSPSYIGKLAYNVLGNNSQFRVSSSLYYTASSAANHLFDGDRSGSRYYSVMTEPGNSPGARGWFATGRYDADYDDEVTAYQGNLFYKIGGLELFGLVETTKGRDHKEAEADKRNTTQLAAEGIYRIGKNENFYVGARYNTLSAEAPSGADVGINRVQLGAGWYLTKNILLKGEYVNQKYLDFPVESIFSEGKFNGFMFEAVVGF